VFASSYLASTHRKYGALELGSLLPVDRAFPRRTSVAPRGHPTGIQLILNLPARPSQD
jgi:hypothetical protein